MDDYILIKVCNNADYATICVKNVKITLLDVQSVGTLRMNKEFRLDNMLMNYMKRVLIDVD